MDKLRKMRAEKGFTLIELLVVIAIIGILAAIAIPQFAAYRRRGYDADVKSNLKNLATTEEAYFVDNDIYTGGAGNTAAFTSRGFTQSANVTITAVGTQGGFTLTAGTAKGCTAVSWSFTSGTGLITGTPCS